MTDVLIRGGRPWGLASPADLLVRDGRIYRVSPSLDAPGALVLDVSGQLVLPGLVDAHCHLDKTLYGGPWVPHSADDSLAGRIANDLGRRAELGVPSAERAAALLARMSEAGTTHVRTHTDIDPSVGLRGVEAVREAAARSPVHVQQVAFPQHGVLTNPGTADLLAEALRGGVEAIGGLDPAGVDRDPVRHLDLIFGLADRFGARIDIHLHDGGSLGGWELELITERTKALGLGGRVTVSHAYALGELGEAVQDRLIQGFVDAGVAIATAAVYSYPVPPVKKLRAAGVTVACGHDGVRDLWGPYGSGDMLERAMHLAYRSAFRRDEDIELALEAATVGGALALGLPGYGLAPGDRADLVVVPASGPGEAVVVHPRRTLVMKDGVVLHN
ncbi:amidohydrolase [Nonomuraea sp. NPDC001636]|uniref:amidohydrolase n=1 Tax=Nonomuraea sp. NPDC001636 TaxID=3154391 RepID=UPI003324E169